MVTESPANGVDRPLIQRIFAGHAANAVGAKKFSHTLPSIHSSGLKNHPYHRGSADRQDTRRRDAACRVSLFAPARFPCLDGPTPHFVDSTIFVDSARETWHATSLPMIPLFTQAWFSSLPQ